MAGELFLSFFPQAVNLAKLYTKERYKTTAINKFKKVLQNPDMWFNSRPFPSNENGNDAFIKCHDATSAQANCPERWKALQKWIKNTNNVSSRANPTVFSWQRAYISSHFPRE